jgi:hypothetical protein
MNALLVIAIACAALFLLLFVRRNADTGCIVKNEVCDNGIFLQEDFVPQNSYNVGHNVSSIVEMDTLAVKAAFTKIMEEDSDKFRVAEMPPFRLAASTREQSLRYAKDILQRINRKANRNFEVLDVQSTRKESSFDPADNGIIDRYMINLFVQEHDSRQVHAAAHNISMSFVVKPGVGEIQVTNLHFITDYYYEGPLVGCANPYDKYFRIMNPFHLQQPFVTTDDKILTTDDMQIQLLKDHHRDAKTPRYRCFGGEGATKSKCERTGGYWDRPVTVDEECPFYQGNKNYVNRLGGIKPDGESCQLPVNMKLVGYRYTSNDPAHKPWCYNCKIGADGSPNSVGPCCDEQRNKQLYPGLSSPDYMFPGDALERGQAWRELGDRGLHWRTHATKIRDTTDRNQKQPVFNAVIGPGPGN